MTTITFVCFIDFSWVWFCITCVCVCVCVCAGSVLEGAECEDLCERVEPVCHGWGSMSGWGSVSRWTVCCYFR